MKGFYILFLLISFSVSAQNFNGQWKGSFVEDSYSFAGILSSRVDYVLELECHGSTVTGYSYTYFNKGGKRYYTICKIKGTLDKTDKEIIVTEFERTKYNTPPDFGNCFQTHKLRYSKDSDDAEILEGDEYKLDLLSNLNDGEITFYTQGNFTDLCRGPHIPSTGFIKGIKLTSISGAYWKGDEKNKMLTRIYGVTFPTQKELDEYLILLEEAKKRDHRKLGKELGIFTMDDDVGPGLILWLPNGTVIIEELEKLAKETELAAGYKRVVTPHIAKESLYLTSGHLPYYKDSMYPPMELEGIKYYLKAMNCPHHHKIFAAEHHSYKDLPLRLAEYGTCYRYEQSGELYGLMRVRCLHMNDAHIYCTREQFAQEFRAVNDMYLKYFKIFGIEKYIMRLSLHDPKKTGTEV